MRSFGGRETVVETLAHGPKQVKVEGVTDGRTRGEGVCDSSVEDAY